MAVTYKRPPISGTGSKTVDLDDLFDTFDELASDLSGEFDTAKAEVTAAANAIASRSIDSDAFVKAITDTDGYAVSIEWLDGTMWAATTPVPVDGIDTDAIKWAETDADGFALRVQWGDGGMQGAEVAKTPRALGDLLVLDIYGQSVPTGSGTAAISTAPATGLKMFSEGSFLSDAGWAGATLTTVVDHVTTTGGQEDFSRGAAEAILQFYADYEGWTLPEVLSMTTARGEQSAASLSSGGAYFGRHSTFLTAAASYARAQGKTAVVAPLGYTQGEADVAAYTQGSKWLADIETGIRIPYQAVLRSTIDPTADAVVVITQVASANYYARPTPEIALAALRLAMERPDHYAFGGAMYQFEYGEDGVGSHLLGGTEAKWAAAQMGRAMAQVMSKGTADFIRPIRARKASSKMIVVEYDVPTAPLVIDTVAVSNPGNAGFSVIRTDTGAALAVASVAVSGRSGVKITLTDDLPSAGIAVRYAYRNGTDSANAGRTTGDRGCLRDSTADTFDVNGSAKSLAHWAPIHSLTVEV